MKGCTKGFCYNRTISDMHHPTIQVDLFYKKKISSAAKNKELSSFLFSSQKF